MYNRAHKARLKAVFSLFIILLILLLGRVLYLQLACAHNLAALARKQHNTIIEFQPKRGTIYDRNMRPLAICLNLDSVYADPRQITDKAKAAVKLSSILNLDRARISEYLNKDKGFVWLKRKIDPSCAARLRSLDIDGVEFMKEPKRVYPNGSLASQLIGYAGMDNNGLEGIELLYDRYLKGAPGYRATLRDARRRPIASLEYEYFPSVDGFDLVLSIDEVIQHIAEREIDKAMKQFHPIGASIIVMDPNTGDILALSSRPTYDLNSFGKASVAAKRDRAVTDTLEPGSTFKIVTASAALENGIVGLNDKFFCENGQYKHAGHILHDHTPHGWLTFRQIIEKSSNIGTVKVAQKLGETELYRAIKNFGFGDLTNIDLPGEAPGYIRPTSKWSKLSICAIPMGQEVTVTPIQIACAMSAIANGGELVRPRVVKVIQDKRGEVIKSYEPAIIRRVISDKTAATMKDILSGVVLDGTGQLAKVEGYKVAGKTGTSQKVESNGTYSHSKFIASFVGFAPAENPKITVVVILDEPRPLYYGGVVAAPVFSRVALDTLRYLDIKPKRTAEAMRDIEIGSVED
ncbi:MAG: penicillin-binding transpeptidase domain-containing protein [Candidatus Omnitrophota bacterium]